MKLITCSHDCPDTCTFSLKIDSDNLYIEPRPELSSDHTGTVCGKIIKNIKKIQKNKNSRIKTPLINDGIKGQPIWRELSWEEALSIIRFKIEKSVNNDSRNIIPFRFSGNLGLLQGEVAYDRLWNKLNTLNPTGSLCSPALLSVVSEIFGDQFNTNFDHLKSVDLLIIWANNPCVTNPKFTSQIKNLKLNGTKVIVIDPIRTDTAILSNLHFQIKVGSDYVLALHFIRRILSNNTKNNLLDKHDTNKLEEYSSPFNLQLCSELTGLPTREIEKLWQLLTQSKSFCIKIGDAISRNKKAYPSVWSICALAIISNQTSHFGGGVMTSKPLNYIPWKNGFSLLDCTDSARKDYYLGDFTKILKNDVDEDKLIFIYNANPVVSLCNSEEVKKALSQKNVFTIVHDVYSTETTDYADIILPATTQYEQYDLVSSYQHNDISMNSPVMSPRFEAKSNFEVANLLGEMIFPNSHVFYQTEEETIENMINTTKMNTGLLNNITFRLLKKLHRLPLGQATNQEVFRKPLLFSQKCETLLEQFFSKKQNIKNNEDKQNTFRLLTVASKKRLSSSLSWNDNNIKSTEVLINPQDAKKNHVLSGDIIMLSRQQVHLSVIAKVSDRVMQGIVVIENGSHKYPNTLTEDVRGEFTDQPCYQDTFVTLKRL